MNDNDSTFSLGLDDRGVSPVIGVALLLGITVVLASAIGLSVLGIGDSFSENPNANVDIQPNDNNGVDVILADKGNVDRVVIVQESNGYNQGSAPYPAAQTLSNTGSSVSSSSSGSTAYQVIGVIEEEGDNNVAVLDEFETTSGAFGI